MGIKNSFLKCIWLIFIVCSVAKAANLKLTDADSPIGERGLVYKDRPVFLVGSGSFWLLNDPYYYNEDGTTNLEHLRAHLDKYKPLDTAGKALGVIRVSAFGVPVRYAGVDLAKRRYPVARVSGAGKAVDGGDKFDCTVIDELFFEHALTVAREADKLGIVLGIILWDEIPLETEGTHRWPDNPFRPVNNINAFGLSGSDGLPEFYEKTADNLREVQDTIIEKFCDVFKEEPNVFFFISNEYTGNAAWRDRQIETINRKNQENNSGLLHVTMTWGIGESAVSDGVAPSTLVQGLSWRGDGRPSIAQRDNSKANGRQTFWQRFMGGAASAGTRDSYNGDTPPATTFNDQAKEDQQLRRFVNSILSSLDRMKPLRFVFPNDWVCRGSKGAEYVAYSTGGGTLDVDLSSEEGE
ncbi:MAG: hypothetical protein HQK83_19585, partial [Fibrobacteria bacterium]|nr:hypothetical protein [Fibrobacteria bacterium]